MQTVLVKKESLIRTVLIDTVLLAFMCLVPALSHVMALPLYKLNPMLLCLLAGMFLTTDRRNAFLLALLLPMVSAWITGMPTPLKELCMSAELVTVVSVFSLAEKKLLVFPSILAAIVLGKGVFYLLKALLLAPAVLIDTNLWLQMAVAVGASALFALLLKKNHRIG